MKLFLHALLLGGILSLCTECRAADVLWNRFRSWQTIYAAHDGDYYPELDGCKLFEVTCNADADSGQHVMPSSPDIIFKCTETGSGIVLTPVAFALLNLSSTALWQTMGKGTIAGYDTMYGNERYLFYHDFYSPRSDYDLKLADGETAYLAIMSLFDMNDPLAEPDNPFMRPAYAWVSLTYDDGELYLSGSAVATLGESIIVGGGSALTPEPSGALMLLLGGGALALSRRLFPSAGGRRKSEK